MTKKSAAQFTPEETQKRFEAALRGARIAGHKSKDEIASPKAKSAPLKRKKTRTKSKSS